MARRIAAVNASILNAKGDRALLVNTRKCPALTEARTASPENAEAWLLSATHEASWLDAIFALPQATREQMIRGLTMFVEGVHLVSLCNSTLDKAERKIKMIEKKSGGEYTERDFDEN